MKFRLLVLLLLLCASPTYSQAGGIARGIKGLLSAFKKPPKITMPRTITNPSGILNANPYNVTRDFYYNPYWQVTSTSRLSSESSTSSMSDYLKNILAPMDDLPDSEISKRMSRGNRFRFYGNRILRKRLKEEFPESFKKGYSPKGLYDAIYDYQVRNDIQTNEFSGLSNNKFAITPEGYAAFIGDLKYIQTKLEIFEKIDKALDEPFHLSYLKTGLSIRWKSTLEPHKEGVFNIALTDRLDDLNILEASDPENSITQKYPDITNHIRNFDFEALDQIIENEATAKIDYFELLEDKMVTLGYISENTEKITINSNADLDSEIDFLTERLINAREEFREEYPEIFEANSPEMSLGTKLDAVALAEEEKLKSILHEPSKDFKSNLKTLFEIHPDLPVNENQLSKRAREKVNTDVKENNYYVKIGNKIERFEKEDIQIRTATDSIRGRSLVKLIPESRVFMETDPQLAENITRLRDNLAATTPQNDFKLVFFTKYKNRRELNKNIKNKSEQVIDSLYKILPPNTLSLIFNKTPKSMKKTLRRVYKNNRGNSIFALGHIEQGAISSVSSPDNGIQLSYIDKLSKDYNIDYFVAGCSSSFYDVRGGTSDLLNDLNFGVAMADAMQNSNTYGQLISRISNHSINADVGEVKIILTEDSFNKAELNEGEVYTKRNNYWQKLTNFLFGRL